MIDLTAEGYAVRLFQRSVDATSSTAPRTSVVAPRSDASLTEAEVIEHCRANLAAYKKPRSVELVAELPKSAYGKILKRELRDRHWVGHERRVGGGERRPAPS